MDEYLPERRWFWRPADRLPERWRLVGWTTDRWARRALGVRVPGGAVFLGLRRVEDAVGPCKNCGRWQRRIVWDCATQVRASLCLFCRPILCDYDFSGRTADA